jgi:DNA polymerase III delta prime subunit
MLLSNDNQKQIKNILVNPPHALIIQSTSKKVGLEAAEHLAKDILKLDSLKELFNYPYYYLIDKTNQTQTIDSVREIIKDLKLKTISKKDISRIVLVKYAELMNIESQNAILKILEEPPVDTIIIVLTTDLDSLLDTLVSRCVIFKINTPSINQINEQKTDKISLNHYQVSGGNSDYIYDDSFANTAISELEPVILAKKFLSAGNQERLLMIDNFCGTTENFNSNLFILKNITKIALDNSIKNKSMQTIRLLNYLNQIQKTIDDSKKINNFKLLYTNLCLNL